MAQVHTVSYTVICLPSLSPRHLWSAITVLKCCFVAGVDCIERTRYALFFFSSTAKMEMYIVQWLEIDLAI